MNTKAPLRRARRVHVLEISEIVRISERAAVMRREGRDIVSFGTGEPDFPTPPHVVEAACSAAKAGLTRYPPTAGLPELRERIATIYGAASANVIVSTGSHRRGP